MDCCFDYATGMHNVVRYWEGVCALVVQRIDEPATPMEGFWPKSNWKHKHIGWKNNLSYVGDLDITPKDEEEAYLYCGPADIKPCTRFNPYRDGMLNRSMYCNPEVGDHL